MSESREEIDILLNALITDPWVESGTAKSVRDAKRKILDRRKIQDISIKKE